MEPRVSLITLGVADLDRSREFYEALGWATRNDPAEGVVFFQSGGMVLALWSREELAKDSGVEDAGGWGGVTLAYNVTSPAAVDAYLERARAAGATIPRAGAATFWGGYSGVFIDPDGHPWEVAHNPFWHVADDGDVVLPGTAAAAAPASGPPDRATDGRPGRHLIETYLDRVWAQRDLTALDALLTADYRRHVSPHLEPLDRTGQRQRLGAMQAAFPDAQIELQDVAVDGELVAFRSVMRGSHQGAFRGLPATGKPFEVHLVDIVRVREGRLAEHWGGPDLLDLLTQLGATVEPGPID